MPRRPSTPRAMPSPEQASFPVFPRQPRTWKDHRTEKEVGTRVAGKHMAIG